MGRALVIALAVWLAPLAALAGGEKARPEPAAEGRDQDPEQRIRQALQKKVTFDFVETPLADVVNFLQALLGVNLILDPGLDKQATVTLRVNEMAAGQALQWIARLVGGKMDVRDGAAVLEPARDEGREPAGPRGRPDAERPPGPGRPLGKATLALGAGLTIEIELREDDLRPEVRQLMMFLVHRQLMAEAQKQDPKALQEFMEGMAKQRQMEAEMRQRMEAQKRAAMDAEARRRAEEEARRQRERREKAEGGEKKGQF